MAPQPADATHNYTELHDTHARYKPLSPAQPGNPSYRRMKTLYNGTDNEKGHTMSNELITSKEQNKARALSAMLESGTLTEAAEKAGISRKTLYNYIRDDAAFGLAYRTARDEMAIVQMETLNNGTARATRLLLELMDDEEQPASIRIKAAQTIISATAKQYEIAQGAKMAAYPLEDMSW